MTSDDVSIDTYGGQVTFQSVKKSDEGRYACNAINDVGADNGHIQLRVLGMQSSSRSLLFGVVDLQANDFFQYASYSSTRGHRFKLYKK